MKGICYDCGQPSPIIHQHHIQFRRINPDLTVPLCPRCHERWHGSRAYYDNRAVHEHRQWMQAEIDAGRYVRWQEEIDNLHELGYLPMWDCWINFEPAAREELLIEFYSLYPKALWNFLERNNRLDLWPGGNP